MNALLDYLDESFIQRNEDCGIIIEPAIESTIENKNLVRRPDAVVVKDNLFILIELKALQGNIMADCSQAGIWKSSDGKGLPTGRQNPFDQASGHRTALINFLQTKFVEPGNAPGWAKRSDHAKIDWITRHVHSWIVTEEASQPVVTGIDVRRNSWFKVVSVDKVPSELAFLRAQGPLFAPVGFARFLESVGAKNTSRNEWYRGTIIRETVSPPRLVPKITNMFDSGIYREVERALVLIKELDLKPHLTHVVRIWRDKRYGRLRLEALLILIEWQYEELGSVLNEALRDDDNQLVTFTLDYLSRFGYPETVGTLIALLEDGPASIRVNVIKALVSSGTRSACTSIFIFAQKHLFNKPFKDFQHWYEHADRMFAKRLDHAEYEEFTRHELKRQALGQLCGTIISALGDLDCKKSLDWLRQILEEPMSLGFESNDYAELDNIHSDYYGFFERTCTAISITGVSDPRITELLVKKLPASPIDFQFCIIRALGDLGDQSAVATLLPFIERGRDDLYNVTVSALSKLRSSDAFDKLAEHYLSDPVDDSGRWTGEALANIDRERFETILLKGIDSKADPTAKQAFLQALLPVATAKSIDTLRPLLNDKVLSYWAEWILSNLGVQGARAQIQK
jgi:HEAT repeat protein